MRYGVRQYQSHNSRSVTNYDFKLWKWVLGNNSVSAKEILEVIFELNGSGASDSLRKEHALYDTTISESVMENTTFYMRYPTPSEEGKILSTNDPDIAAEGTSTG